MDPPALAAAPGTHMAWFFDQSPRLLRHLWSTPTQLAQELYAMFQADIPMTTDAPVTINNPNPQLPAVTIQQPNNPNAPYINMKDPKGNPIGGLGVNPSNGKPALVGANGQPQQQQGSVFPGQVQSGGPGAGPYVVTIYPNGTGNAGQNVNVTQLQINGGSTVPSGAWVIVVQTADNSYYMQLPVWQ